MIRRVVDFLPLKYLAYFPSAVFLGKVTGQELIRGLLMQFGWLLFFIVVCRVAYARGVKRYKPPSNDGNIKVNGLRWSHFVGQFSGAAKVYSGV